jgi:hypothetical protein
MKKRVIIAKFEIEDTDRAEKILFDNLNCIYLKDFYKLQDNSELFEKNKTLRILYSELKESRKKFNDYLNSLK